MLGKKLLNIQFAKYHIWNNKSEGFPNMVLSTETFNQSVRTEYSEAVSARYTFQPLWVSVIIHQTHYEKSDWSRAFNQFTIACELDMINVKSAADITFIMFNVCLVTKPLGVFSETKWLNASLLFLRMNYVKNV